MLSKINIQITSDRIGGGVELNEAAEEEEKRTFFAIKSNANFSLNCSMQFAHNYSRSSISLLYNVNGDWSHN